MALRRLPLLVSSCFLLAGSACAAELGEPRVSSWRGQTLVADIELSALDDANAPVQARVASADVYRGASIGVPPVLASLNLNVVRRDGRQFVHVTSVRPVDSEMLHLFLDLSEGGRHDVRLATLWLATDPHPAPPVPAAPPPAQTALVAPIASPAPAVKQERAHAVTAIDPAPAAHPLPLALAVSTVLPASLRSAAPASCKPSAQNNACAVLDTKNAALRAQLHGLEGKIKLLQASLTKSATENSAPVHAEAAATAPVALPAAKPAALPVMAPVKAPPAPVAVLVKPKKHQAPAPAQAATPWLWIGMAATIGLLAIAAIVYLLLRRRRGKASIFQTPSTPEGGPSRLMPDGEAPRVEPGLTGAI